MTITEALGSRIAPRRAAWSAALKAISSKSLEFRPDFPEVARRWERWWHFEAERPLLVGSVAKRTDIRWDKAFDLLEQPDAWLRVRRQQLEGLHWFGDTVPSIRVDLGPVVTGAMLGAPLHFAPADNTSWQTPSIASCSDDAIPRLDPRTHWLKVILALADRTAQDAAGRYVVNLPDFSGAVDILANLRGSENLLMDLYDSPGWVMRAADRTVDAWEHAFGRFYETVLSHGAGAIGWLQVWSDEPYTIPTCDFNYMIGPEQFRQFCLPSLAEQGRRAGRCLLHVDGPGAAKHAEALAEAPEITAVQFTPGAGTPSALPWIDMFRMLQRARKPLVVICPVAEVAKIVNALDHRGLTLIPEGISTPHEADDLFDLVSR